MKRAIFVTATDTNAGKTWVSKALLEEGLKLGLDIQALKPIASGLAKSGLNEDVEQLLTSGKNANQINYKTYHEPVAPALAAMHEGEMLDSELLNKWLHDARARSEFTLIEGVGGLMVPLRVTRHDSWLVSDWLKGLSGVDVLLVVPLRLGCMSQLLLSCECLIRMGKPPKWIVLNDLEGNGTAEETEKVIAPVLSRMFKEPPEIISARQPADLVSILRQ